MKILWIPHGTWEKNTIQRDQYFIDQLKKSHEIHVLIWSEPIGPKYIHYSNPIVHLRALRDWSRKKNEIYLHHFRRLCFSRFTLIRKINEWFFQKKIKSIVDKYLIDIIVCGPNHYLNGFPPFDIGCPIIYDYLDFVPYDVTKTYLRKSDAVLCVSNTLLKYSSNYNKKSFYISNTINLTQFKTANPDKIQKKYNLEGFKVVSLIGLSTSSSFYILDTLPLVKKVVPNVKYLIVGDTPLLERMKKKANNSEDIIFTGWVENVQDYFSVTDVGVYPTDKTIYDDSRCPIKILEYTATKKPVVSANIEEVKYWNFPNVLISEPNKDDFAKNIIKALSTEFQYPNLDEFLVENRTKELENIMKSLVK